MMPVILILLLIISVPSAWASSLPPIGSVVPPPPIDASGNIVNPAADPGDNTDTGQCEDIYYFHQSSGSDINNCTSPGTACKTADKWDDLAVDAGDCILYARGQTWTNDDPRFDDLPNGSASGGYVTVGSYGSGARPKFVFTSIHPTWRFTNKSYIQYERFETDGIWIWRINTGSHHLAWRYVRNVKAYDTCMTWRSGGSGHPHHMTLVGVACEDTATTALSFCGSGVNYCCRNATGGGFGEHNGCGEGFYIGGNAVEFQGALDVHIQGCYTTGLFNESVSTKAQVRRVTIKGCLFENNVQADDPGIMNCGNSDSDSANILFDGNVLLNNQRNHATGGTPGNHAAVRLGRGCKAINNVVVDNEKAWCLEGESSSEFYHNTCWSNDNGFRRDAGIPAAKVKNNIGEPATGSTPAASTISDNIDAVTALFEDTSTDDFRLKSGSAAIDLYSNCRGVSKDIFGTNRPVGSTCDAGAWEFDGGGGGGDVTPPTVPTNLIASTVSTSQINLTWTASTDAVGVTGYDIERCKGSGCLNFAEIAESGTNSYNATGLEPSTTYAFRVRAFDAAGNLSGYSNTAQATTTQSSGIVFKVVSTTTPTSITTQTITDAGFSGAVPNAAIFIITPTTVLGTDVANAQMGIGWTDGNVQNLTLCEGLDNQTATANECMVRNDALVGMAGFSTGSVVEVCTASLNSFVADGISIDWTSACASAYQMAVVLISGIQAKAFDVLSPSTATTVQVGSIMFQPNFLLGLKTRAVAFGTSSPSLVMNWLLASDATPDVSLSSSIGWKNGDNPSTVTAQVDSDSHFVCGETKCLTTPDHQFTTTAYSANGVDLVFTTTDPSERLPFLAMGQDIDDYTTEIITTPGTADAGVTPYTFGFQPDFGLCVMSHLSSTDTAISTADAGTQGIFVTDFTTTLSSFWGQSNAASPVQTYSGMETGVKLRDSDGAALYQGAITATATGIEIDFTDNPAQADKWMCLFAEGTTSTPPPTSGPGDKDYIVINAQASGATGTQTISSAEFKGQTPAMAKFYMTSVTALGTDVAGAQLGIGWTDGTNQSATICTSEDNQDTTDSDCGAYEDRLIGIADFSGTPGGVLCSATFDSFVADGVVIDWGGTACPSNYQMVVVLAANDVVSADAFKITEPGAVSTVSKTGMTFEADLLYGLKTREPLLDGAWAAPSFVLTHQFSRNSDPDTSFSAGWGWPNSEVTSDATALIETDRIGICGETRCTSLLATLNIDSYSGNGMDFVYTSSDNPDENAYIAWKTTGLQSFLGTIQTPSSADAGATSYSIGFRPQYLECTMTHLNATDVADSTDLAATQGILLSDFTNTYSVGVTHSDGDDFVQTSSILDQNVVLRDGDGAALYQATITDDANGFTINFSDNPAQSDYWLCLAVERGQAPPAPSVTGISGGSFVGGEIK